MPATIPKWSKFTIFIVDDGFSMNLGVALQSTNHYTLKNPQMIAMQSFEVLKILNSFEIKSDRISAECGL
jgi:hypothetical protein